MWNMLTLMDNPKADRPERCTALVARELDRYNLDIVALTSMRRENSQKQEEATLSSGVEEESRSIGNQELALQSKPS